mmetsp:Transcript_88423/g.249164  ORF Transcript_88423/g.249164 Transcript_88423/m.249164 type:complete len:364 (-) Transcript_88423:111-1202(-)
MACLALQMPGRRVAMLLLWSAGRTFASDLVAFNSTDGQMMLLKAMQNGTAACYANIAAHFETQGIQSVCSAATGAMMLNSLSSSGIPMPTTGATTPYAYHTQSSILSGPCVATVETESGSQHEVFGIGYVASWGATFDEVVGYWGCWAAVTAAHASEFDEDALRVAVRRATHGTLGSKVDYALALNYDRRVLGQVGDLGPDQPAGHWSPIAAYHEGSDMVLVMDVARYKYPPMWVPLKQAFAATSIVDGTSGKSRGWVALEPAPRKMPPPAPNVLLNSGAVMRIRACIAAAGNDWLVIQRCMAEPSGAADAPALPDGIWPQRVLGVVPVVLVLSAVTCAALHKLVLRSARTSIDQDVQRHLLC